VELLDDPRADPARVERSLRNVARSNTWFGGTAAALYGIERVLAGNPGPTLLLDVGTGLGDLPRAAIRHFARRGRTLTAVGIERHPAAARLARGDDLSLLLACAGALPIRERSADVVLISQVLHHFDRASAAALLRAAHRIARRGVVVADLRRSRVARILFQAGARALRFDADTRRDGATSVLRGYTSAELRSLCESAGVRASVVRRPGFRLVAWWRTGEPHP
jgi:ubiquinone/menaquinone biosynthesis C-methylase UbiE